MNVYHQVPIPVCTLRYFTPEVGRTRLKHEDSTDTEDKDVNGGGASGSVGGVTGSMRPHRKRLSKSFLEPGENTFANIRHKLSTLSLSTEYKKSQESASSGRGDYRSKRVSSLSPGSIPNVSRGGSGKNVAQSRNSFLSDDKDYRGARRSLRAGDMTTLRKLDENFLLQRQNHEYYAQQMRHGRNYNDRDSYRSSSPKSVKSIDSSGHVHLGLIESLDLNEQLNDVEKIKARYSNHQFMNFLNLYKQRGHDKCMNQSGISQHIPRGTRLMPLDTSRPSSKISWDSGYAINSVVSPRASLASLSVNGNWEPDKSKNSFTARLKPRKDSAISRNTSSTTTTQKKSVAFHEEHLEISDDELPPSSKLSTYRQGKKPKSILKRAESKQSVRNSSTNNNDQKDVSNDEFVINENYHWKVHLPKIRSPISTRHKPLSPFRRGMYQYGSGISTEFEEVISKYGNCRQASIIRDPSFSREHSNARDSKTHVK